MLAFLLGFYFFLICSPLYILGINSLSTTCIANISSHSVSYFLTLFILLVMDCFMLHWSWLVTLLLRILFSEWLWVSESKDKPVHDLEGKNEAEAIILGESLWSDTVTRHRFAQQSQRLFFLSGALCPATTLLTSRDCATSPCMHTHGGCGYREAAVSTDLLRGSPSPLVPCNIQMGLAF